MMNNILKVSCTNTLKKDLVMKVYIVSMKEWTYKKLSQKILIRLRKLQGNKCGKMIGKIRR